MSLSRALDVVRDDDERKGIQKRSALLDLNCNFDIIWQVPQVRLAPGT